MTIFELRQWIESQITIVDAGAMVLVSLAIIGIVGLQNNLRRK